MKDHPRNRVSYNTSLRIQAFESLEAFKTYYAIGASIYSLHRESTDFLICTCLAWNCMWVTCIVMTPTIVELLYYRPCRYIIIVIGWKCYKDLCGALCLIFQ